MQGPRLRPSSSESEDEELEEEELEDFAPGAGGLRLSLEAVLPGFEGSAAPLCSALLRYAPLLGSSHAVARPTPGRSCRRVPATIPRLQGHGRPVSTCVNPGRPPVRRRSRVCRGWRRSISLSSQYKHKTAQGNCWPSISCSCCPTFRLLSSLPSELEAEVAQLARQAREGVESP